MKSEEIEARLKTIGTNDCRKWSRAIFERHTAVSMYLKSAYVHKAKSVGYVQANKLLRQLNSRLLWNKYSVSVGVSEIERAARWYQLKSIQIYEHTFKRTGNVVQSSLALHMYIRKHNLPNSLPSNWETLPEEKLLIKVKRLFDETWWKRNIKKIFRRQLESVLRDIGGVKKQTSPYVSAFNLAKYKQDRIKNNQMIDAMMLESEEGDVISLRDAVDASVSNPKVQRAELMVRFRGTEDVAKKMGLSPLFITMTCPSKYHAFEGNSGRQNSKYQGLTPLDGRDYLIKTFSEIRADLSKRKIKNAGFRICEPHHDGTPHFHLLLYVLPQYAKLVGDIFKKHSLKEDGDEEGADHYRCDIKELDLIDGSATGYIAKYIAKNIDGEDVGTDHETGQDASSSALRVKAWASTWGIRQFSQIGNIPQTVFREFRRLPEQLSKQYPEQAEQARKAADESNYAGFIEANGGLFVGRKELPFRAMHIIKESASKFGEDIKRLVGIAVGSGQGIRTRFTNYTIVPAWMVDTQKAARPPTLEYCQ